jgi:CubicO group peptidase (beta-lactamase class C family)
MPHPFLPGEPRLALVTPRRVLSHTTGFQDWRSQTEPLKIHFTPGEKFCYSGEGYHYLQSVITHLQGHIDPGACSQYEAGFEVCATDIDPWLKSHLLMPFGMKSSGYVWNDAFQKNFARPHDIAGRPFAKKKPTATDAARYAAPGGLHTTATDYARFLLEILQPEKSDAFRLNNKSLAEMLRPQIRLAEDQHIDDATSWALGWAVQERKSGNVIVHSGGNDGFRSLTMASVERKSGFIILTNSDNGGRVFYHPTFMKGMDQLLAG